MNKFSHGLILTAALIGIGMSQAAVAADSTTPVIGSATIDWSQLQLSVTGVAGIVPTVLFSGYLNLVRIV